MKRKLGYLCAIMLCIAALGAAFSYVFGTAGQSGSHQQTAGQAGNGEESDFLVVTSFYPVYVMAQNLCEGIPGVQVENLTPNQTGCLHDYQLTTKDMKLLEQADVLLLNGGGMETFLETIAANLPELPVVSSEQGIEMLDIQSEHNAHMWLDPVRYQQQVRNLTDGLIEQDPSHRTQYEANRDMYLAEIEQIEREYHNALGELTEQPVIIFHEAFAYLAESMPLEIVKAVEIEGDESALSAGEMAEVIEEIKLHQIPYLLMEEQYRQTVADVLAEETGASTVVLDSLASGDGSADSWLSGMRANLEILQKYFGTQE